MIGIYRIHDKVNNLDYIGQSIHIETRWEQHKDEAKQLRVDRPLYNAMNKLGFDNFEFTILEECAPQELDARERYWVKYYDAYENGYNLTPGGQGQYFEHQNFFDLWDAGKTVSQIVKETGHCKTTVNRYLNGYKDYNASTSHKRGGIQARQTAIENNKESSLYNTTLYRYDWKGNYIDEWKSGKEIKRQLGIDGEQVYQVIRGVENRKTAGGYQWRAFKADKITPQSNTPNGHVILCLNTKDIFPSATEASQWANLKTHNGVLNSCNSYGTGNHSSAGKDADGNKLYWKYWEDGDIYNS